MAHYVFDTGVQSSYEAYADAGDAATLSSAQSYADQAESDANTYAAALGTSAATANTIARRDANARLQVATPSATADVSTKGYVDDKTWDAATDLTGVIADGNLPLMRRDIAYQVTDFDSAIDSGWYRGNNATNKPSTASWHYVQTINHNDQYVVQIAYDYWNNLSWIRRRENGTWQPWSFTSSRFIGVYRPTSATTVASATTTKIPMGYCSWGDSSRLSSGDVVIPITGTYRITYRMVGPNAAGGYRISYLYVNGSATEWSDSFYPTSGASFRFDAVAYQSLSANDTVSLYASQDSGASMNMGSTTIGANTAWARLSIELVDV